MSSLFHNTLISTFLSKHHCSSFLQTFPHKSNFFPPFFCGAYKPVWRREKSSNKYLIFCLEHFENILRNFSRQLKYGKKIVGNLWSSHFLPIILRTFFCDSLPHLILLSASAEKKVLISQAQSSSAEHLGSSLKQIKTLIG
jgi:hypothetical protein